MISSWNWWVKNVHKGFLIFRHEMVQTLRRVGFIILTLALPVLTLLGIGVFHLASGVSKPAAEVTRIGYVDEASVINRGADQGKVTFVPFDSAAAATQAMIDKDIKEYFVIPADYATRGLINYFTLAKQPTVSTDIQAAMKDFLLNNLLAGKVPAAMVGIVGNPVNLVTTRLTATGAVATDQGGMINLIVPGVFSLLLALSLAFSSAYVLQGLGEEKENRLMEILLSSASTRQLITGKVLGIGAAGLVQMVFWVITLPLLLNLASSSIGGIISMIHVPAGFLVLGVVYFILGYLLFATLSSGVAAVSANVREGQGLASIFTMFSVAPFWFYSLLLLFPNSPIWIIFSIFPFSAPVLVMLRLGMVGVPAWQLAASIAVMLLSIIGGLLLSAKLLRAYLLMYGKRPSMGEIIRNLRSS
jgi:ABC-2 type transport system permease protein